MGLGSTAKKVQLIAERAEQLVEQLVELRERVIGLEESVDESTRRLRTVERRTEEQHALLVAIAEEQGIDVDRVIADATIQEAEAAEDAAPADVVVDAEADAASDSSPGADADDGSTPDAEEHESADDSSSAGERAGEASAAAEDAPGQQTDD